MKIARLHMSGNKEWQAVLAKVLSLSVRERWLMVLTFSALLVFGMLHFWVAPVWTALRQEQAQWRDAQQNDAQMQAELQGLRLAVASMGPSPKEQLDEVLQQQALSEQRIRAELVNLASPEDMSRMIRSLLKPGSGVVLTGFKTFAPERASDIGVMSAMTLYRHSVQMELSGNYFAIVQYLSALEKTRWRFHWNSLRYQVHEWPRNKVMIVLYTYSSSTEVLRV